MKPSFALTISQDSVGLLHRTPKGWLSIGSVRFDAPDLDADLARLRDAALALAPEGLATKLVIPNSEILFDTVTAPGPKAAERRAQIAAALEGRTPYTVDELVYDWSGTGEEVQVAVVARETLAEAEAFAVQHGLNPVSFVAIPEPGGFAAEPWFGTAAALPKGEKVVRDQDPIRIIAPVGPAPAAEAATAEPAADPQVAGDTPDATAADAPVVAAEESPAQSYTEIPAAVAPEEVFAIPEPFWRSSEPPAPAADPAPDVAAPEPEADAATANAAAFETATPQPETAEDATRAALTVAAATVPSDVAAQADATPADEALDGEAADDGLTLDWSHAPTDPLDSTKAALAASLAPAPDPVQAALVAGLRREHEPLDDVPPMPGALRAPPPRRPEMVSALSGPAVSEKVQRALGKVTRSAKGKPRKPAERPSFAPPPPPLPASASQPRVPQPASEAEAMTVFGQRQSRVGGKPRYLGIALTAVLLLLLLLVAVWAANFLEPQDRAERDDPTVAASDQAAIAPPPASMEQALDPSADEGENSDPVLVIDEGEPVPTATAATEPLPEPEAATPPMVETAPTTVTAGLGSANADGTVAPRPADELTLPLPDPVLGAAPQARLAGVSASNTDLAPDGSPVLQEFGALYRFDPQGNIIPTPEGVITPDGVRLVAGRPAVVPPQRPATAESAAPVAAPQTPAVAAPAEAPVPQAEAPALAAVDPGPGSIVILPAPGEAAAATESASGFRPDTSVPSGRPRLRPQEAAVPAPSTPVALPAETTPTAPAEEEGALPAGTAPETAAPVSPGFAARRPPARPAAIAAAADAARARQLAETAAAAAAAASTSASASTATLALAPTRRPASRPANFARNVETAVAAAVAQPRAATTASAAAPGARRPAAEPEDDGEPEVTRAAPSIPTRASVARQATVTRALSLGRINLIGVFGTNTNRYALVREGGGRLVRVKVGDRLDGGRVTAIGQSDLSYQKGSGTQRLQMPRS